MLEWQGLESSDGIAAASGSLLSPFYAVQGHSPGEGVPSSPGDTFIGTHKCVAMVTQSPVKLAMKTDQHTSVLSFSPAALQTIGFCIC